MIESFRYESSLIALDVPLFFQLDVEHLFRFYDFSGMQWLLELSPAHLSELFEYTEYASTQQTPSC